MVCDALKKVYKGDIYVKVKGFMKEQKEFTILAPFLMTGVDSDPKECKACREYVLEKYKGYLIVPGHGALVQN